MLENSVPFFAANPDKLQLFTDGGQIISTGAKSFSHEYRYTLNLIVTDYAEDIATLTVPLLAYLRNAQPELFENPARREDALKFEMDYNNNLTADISIEIKLTERVVAKETKDGEIRIDYAPEPLWEQSPERLRIYLQNTEQLIFGSKPPKTNKRAG